MDDRWLALSMAICAAVIACRWAISGSISLGAKGSLQRVPTEADDFVLVKRLLVSPMSRDSIFRMVIQTDDSGRVGRYAGEEMVAVRTAI